MTLAETTRSRTHRTRSATELFWSLDVWHLLRFVVWVAFCVLLLVLA
jgi:hypothetical protein